MIPPPRSHHTGGTAPLRPRPSLAWAAACADHGARERLPATGRVDHAARPAAYWPHHPKPAPGRRAAHPDFLPFGRPHPALVRDQPRRCLDGARRPDRASGSWPVHPHRGTESAAQLITADRPLWRADLFDRLGSAPGSFDAAHYHPRFAGVEPCGRVWDPALTAATRGIGWPIRSPASAPRPAGRLVPGPRRRRGTLAAWPVRS